MKLRLTVLLSLFYSGVFAQDDLMQMLEEDAPKQKEFVYATFKGTRMINFHTNETPGKRTLEFRIAHHFGDLNSGAYNFWGLDGGASIRLGLEYSYDGRLAFGIGRNSLEKMYDGFVKYRLLRQTTDNSMPLSVTLFSGMFYTTLKDPNKAITGIDRYQYRTSRMSYANEIIIARKFSESFSFQIAPTMIHYNLVDAKTDKNDVYILAFATRYKITRRMALNLEYGYRLNKYTSKTYYDAVGIGIEIETGGHVFQMYFTNSLGIVEPQYFTQTTSKWQNAGLKLGFNISRVFSL